MVTPAVDGIDLFKIAGRSISGWIPSFKAGVASPGYTLLERSWSPRKGRPLMPLLYQRRCENSFTAISAQGNSPL